MSKLILIRHGQSIWNAANKFTGWVDVPLSKRGRAEAMIAADKLRSYRIDVCFTSLLIRAIETAILCLTEYEALSGNKTPILKHDADDHDWHGWDHYEGEPDQELPIFPSVALDERYYGQLQGLDKAQTVAKFGAAQVQEWRRSYSTRPPGGESLEDTQQRVIPYFTNRILSHVTVGETVLVAAHGNSLRSIIMKLENLAAEAVPALELATGIPLVYDIDVKGEVREKRILI